MSAASAMSPPSNRNKMFAGVVVFALIALGFGVVYLQGGTGTASPTTSANNQLVTPTEYGSISNTNISVTELFNDIGGLYFGSAVDQALHIQLFTGTLTERLTNVTLDLTGSPLGVPLLMVSQGTLTAQIVPAGFLFKFRKFFLAENIIIFVGFLRNDSLEHTTIDGQKAEA